jgi:hypothetical protein
MIDCETLAGQVSPLVDFLSPLFTLIDIYCHVVV